MQLPLYDSEHTKSAAGRHKCCWQSVACDISLVYSILFMGGSSQLNLGGTCYRDVPSMSQIQPPAQPPTVATPAGYIADPPHGSEVGEDAPDKSTRKYTPCRETMGQNTDRAWIFGYSFVDLNVKASRRRKGAERADPPTPRVSAEEGARPSEEIAWKCCQRRERSADQKRIGSG